MLEETVDDIIDEHWAYPDNGVYVTTETYGVYGDVKQTPYDVILDDDQVYIAPQPSGDGDVLATITYDDHPVIDVADGVDAHIEYKAHPEYQNGLLQPLHRTASNDQQAPLLTTSQVKNTIAGLRPPQAQQLFKDGLTEVNLSPTTGRRRTHTIQATYQGLRSTPDKENYDMIIQGMTRPHGEHPYRST
jgi:hypothetical protein